MKKTLLPTKNIKSLIALLAFSLVINYSWGQVDLSSYDLINTGDANDPVSIHSFSKEEVNGTTKNNAATNTLDKDNGTVWAADDGDVLSGDYKGDGEYIIYDLGESQDVRVIQFTTTNKSDPFGYQVWISTTGTDAADFTKILPTSDDILLTATSTTDFNQYEIQDGVSARYIKVIGYGRYNSAGDTRTSAWNAIGEIEFYEPGTGNGDGGDDNDDDNDDNDDDVSDTGNLVLNGTADEHGTGSDTSNTSDNADAWDMTPNSTLNGGITSPYRYDADDNPSGWRNDDLETYLENTYASGGSVNEQPGSTSDGNYNDTEKTRGVKLYGETRRLYQRVIVEAGSVYTFTIQSRSNASGTPSQVFMLNEAISTEVGLENGAADSRVDHYFEITNDENSSGGSVGNDTFTTTTFDFTPSNNDVVIYVRALNSTDSNQVYFDNISLVKKVTASTEDVFAANFSVYPNPANNFINISTKETISSVELYNIVGKRVLSVKNLQDNKLDISNLSSGIYMLRVSNGTSIATKKIIKK